LLACSALGWRLAAEGQESEERTIVHRKLGALAVALATFGSVATTASAANVSINPAGGSQTDTFTVAGDGLQPGLALDINFKSPEGNLFSTSALNQVVIVDPDGTFRFEFVPVDEFKGSSLGTWLVQVCITQTDDCVQGTFQVAS
jgi:hypothetical protein